VAVNLFGENLDVLDEKAAEVAHALRAWPGAAEVEVKSPPGAPRMAIRLRPVELTAFGLRPVDALEASKPRMKARGRPDFTATTKETTSPSRSMKRPGKTRGYRALIISDADGAARALARSRTCFEA